MFYIRMMYVMSTLLPIFFLFYFKFFKIFKFGRNFLKFTAGMCYRLVAVSGKFGGNRRLPTGKVNPGREATAAAGVSIEGEAHAVTRVGRRSADLLVR